MKRISILATCMVLLFLSACATTKTDNVRLGISGSGDRVATAGRFRMGIPF